MIRGFWIAAICLFFVRITSAKNDSCNYSMSGKILDVDTKEPLPYVSVLVQGTSKGMLTSENGAFSFTGLCSKRNTLIISCHGYCDSICETHYQEDKIPHIYLTQKVEDVGVVNISVKLDKKAGTESIAQVDITKKELEQNPTQSLAEAVEKEQGVTMASTGSNINIPIIHGLYGNRVLILNNGIKHGFQNWGTGHAPEIDVASANKIRVVKGAAGVQYGPEALGGVIIVETNPLYFQKPFYVNLSSGYQTNGKGFNGGFETGYGGKKWSYFINGNFTKIGGRFAPQYQLTNTGKEERAVSAGTRYSNEKIDFKLYYSYLDQNLGILRASYAHSPESIIRAFNSTSPDDEYILPFSYEINEPNQLTQHHLGKVELKWRYSDHANLTFTAGRQLNNRQEFDVRRNSDWPIIDLSLNTSDYQLEWKHPDWGEFDGVIGIQYFYQDNDNNAGTGTTPFIPNYNSNRYSAFIVKSKRLGKTLLELGVRGDIENNDVRGREVGGEVFRDNYSFTNLTASVGLVREIGKNGSFRSNLGSAWRTPNMAELYSFGQHGFRSSFGLLRYYYNENDQLKTDQVLTLSSSGIEAEKGYKFINEYANRKGKHTQKLMVYSHYIFNYIYERPFAMLGSFRGPQAAFIIDQADALFAGVDYSWEMKYSDQFTGTVGGSYLWSRNISDQEALINQPPITINYKLSWTSKRFLKLDKSQFDIKPFYRFRQFQAPRVVTPEALIEGEEIISSNSEIFDFKAAPAGYFMLNISWNCEWKNFGGGITVNNALNNTYRDYLNYMRYFADAPGINVLFNLRYKFQTKNKS